MDQVQQTKQSRDQRPLGLTVSMCIAALLAALVIWGGGFFGAMILLMVMGGAFAVMYLTAQTPVLPVLGASLSVMLLQLVGGFTASLSGLIILIAALVLAYQVKRSTPKTSVLVTVALVMGIGFLLVAAIFYAMEGGSLAPSDLLEEYHALFKELKVAFAAEVRAMVEEMDDSTLALYAQMGVTEAALLESYLGTMEDSLDLVQLILPGILVFVLQLLAYAAISAFRLVAKVCHVDALMPTLGWSLMPTQVSCVFYLIAAALYMIGSFFASETSAFMVIMANLWLVLLPVMLLCGFRVLFKRLGHPMYRTGTGMMIAVFVLGLFFLPSVAIQLALFMLSFLGAQTVSAMHMAESEKNKNQR